MYDTPIMFTDNQSDLLLCKNPVYHKRSKHIEVKYHFIREKLSLGEVELVKIHTDRNSFDVETKILPAGKFKLCLSLLHIDTG